MVIVANRSAEAGVLHPDPDSAWSATSPALVELLDHLAAELAREYVRLMEKAAEDTNIG